jgi:signal transduction histidine kinase
MPWELRPPLIWWMRPKHWIALDCLTSAVLLVVATRGAAGRTPQFGLPTALGVGMSALAVAPIAVRRIAPMTAFAVVLVANTVVVLIGVSGDPAVLLAVVLYTVAMTQPPRRSVISAVATLVLTLAALTISSRTASHARYVQVLFTASVTAIAAAWTLGTATREHRRWAARTAERAAQEAVADERLRIARELHDVLAHSMSLITAKAAVTNYLLDARPEEARSALSVIEATGRSALVEMRRMLGVLRDGADSASPYAPTPGLADLETLADLATEAGVRTHLDVYGDRNVPEGVSSSTYRIVQEALTNAVKHATPAHCRVRVDITAQEVAIEIVDDGRGGRAGVSTAGHGIAGMRERANLLGGELSAGPSPSGGFRVTARLPIGLPAAGAGASREAP